MATGRQGTKQQQPADEEFDPKYEWQESATSFILRLHLSGFRKEDFKVQVDGTGRLTVRGQRALGGGKQSTFKKIFQLPQASNLDGITGRFDTGVLTVTVPKKVVEDAKPKEDATKAAAPPQEQGKPKEHEAKKPQAAAEHKEAAEVAAAKKPKDDAKPKEDATITKKPLAPEQPVDAKRGKPEQEQRSPPAPAPPATVSKEEAEPKPTAEAAAPAADKKQATPTPTPTPPATVSKEEVETKPTAEAAAPAADKKQATPTPPQADAERKKAVDPESLAAVAAKRRAEEEKAAAAAEEAERQIRPRRGLRERVQEELEGLAGSEWTEGLVETVKKNKEVIAAAVAAFSLGLFASRIFSRN